MLVIRLVLLADAWLPTPFAHFAKGKVGKVLRRQFLLQFPADLPMKRKGSGDMRTHASINSSVVDANTENTQVRA